MKTLKTDQLKGAVVGVGYLGRFHAQKIQASSQAQLVGVFDFHTPQAEKIAAELQVTHFKTLEDVAAAVDFVTIAASTQAHFELAEFFLKKNIPTLVEKPVAATAELGAKLCELAKKNKVVFSVGHIERFNPAYNYLKENQQKIKYLELNRLAPFRTRGSDVSVLHDLMIHDLDLVNFIFNQKIKNYVVFGHKMIRETIDDVSVLLTLESGTQVHIQNSRLTPQIIRNYRAVMDDRVIVMNTATLEAEILFRADQEPDLHRIEKFAVPKVDALALEIEHFMAAVKQEKPVAITGEEATSALRTIEEIVFQHNFMNKVMIIAAEASSAHYAAQLIKHWKKDRRNIEFFGVGTQEMENLGFRRIGKAEEMAVVGLVEVIKHFSHLKTVFNQLLAAAQAERPDFVILMDYPDFNLRLAKKLKALDIKVFYYISPQVWAWRKSRIYDIKAYCEKVFLLFPFEKNFYDHYQVPNEFVGHPLLEDIDPSLYDKEQLFFHRQKYGINAHEKVLSLMPGSRRGEIEKNFPIQLETAKIILKKYKNIRLAICVAPTLTKEVLIPYLENFDYPYLMFQDDPNRMIALADLVLVASGTATLMVGLLQKPMVIMYKVNWLTGVIGAWLTKGLKFFGLINLVHDQSVVPECKQADANPENLAQLLEKYLNDPVYTEKVIQTLKKTPQALGYLNSDPKSATQKVIESLNGYLK